LNASAGDDRDETAECVRGGGAADSSGRGINYIIRHDCHVSERHVQRERFLGFIYIYMCMYWAKTIFSRRRLPTAGDCGAAAKETRRSRKMFLQLSSLFYLFYFFILLFRSTKLSPIKRTLIKRNRKVGSFLVPKFGP